MSDALISPLVGPGNARAEIAAAVRAHIAVNRSNDSELGRAIGMSQSKVSRRTNEEVPFDSDDLGRIARHFGISVVELIQMPKEAPRPQAPNSKSKDYGSDVSREIAYLADYQKSRPTEAHEAIISTLDLGA